VEVSFKEERSGVEKRLPVKAADEEVAGK